MTSPTTVGCLGEAGVWRVRRRPLLGEGAGNGGRREHWMASEPHRQHGCNCAAYGQPSATSLVRPPTSVKANPNANRDKKANSVARRRGRPEVRSRSLSPPQRERHKHSVAPGTKCTLRRKSYGLLRCAAACGALARDDIIKGATLL